MTDSDSGNRVVLPLSGAGQKHRSATGGEKVRGAGGAGRSLFRASNAGRIKPAAFARLIDDLSGLIAAGLRLDDALSHLAEDESRGDQDARGLARALHGHVLTGGGLADGLRQELGEDYPMAAALARAGEQAGQLPQTLSALADYLQRVEDVKTELRSALTYPLVVLAVALLSLGVLFIFVVPGFQDIYARQGSDAPLIAQIIFTLSDVMKWVGLPALILLGAGGWYLLRNGGLSRIPLPWLQGSLLAIEAERFARAFGLLQSRGVAVDEAIGLAADGLANGRMKSGLLQVAENVRQGQALSDALGANSDLRGLPSLLVMLIRVGEQTGDIGSVALKAADLLHRDSQRDIKEKLTWIEPGLIIFTGLLVGGIVLGLMSVIVGLNSIPL